jgi:hypothetical protein
MLAPPRAVSGRAGTLWFLPIFFFCPARCLQISEVHEDLGYEGTFSKSLGDSFPRLKLKRSYFVAILDMHFLTIFLVPSLPGVEDTSPIFSEVPTSHYQSLQSAIVGAG